MENYLNVNQICQNDEKPSEAIFLYWEDESGNRKQAGIGHYTPHSKFGEYKFKINFLGERLFYLKQTSCEGNRIQYQVFSVMECGLNKIKKAQPAGAVGVSNKIPVDQIYIETPFRELLVMDLRDRKFQEEILMKEAV